MKALSILIISLFFTHTAVGQNKPDSLGFTDKKEAKNITVKGLKEGKWVEYNRNNDDPSDTNPIVYRLEIFKNGKLNGIAREFYKNGKLANESFFVDNKRSGMAKAYYEDGHLSMETPFSKGIINGLEKAYYEDGKLKRESSYVNGKEGSTKNYDENGNEIK